MISNYGELKTAVSARSRRSDSTTLGLIPDFIRSAHDVIVNRLPVCTQMALDAATEAFEAREVLVVMIDTFPAYPLTLATQAQMTDMGAGVPQYYQFDGTELSFAPAPNATFNARVLHKLSRDFFANDAATNLVLTRYPFLYLYGAMAELFADARDIEQEGKYRALFANGLDLAEQAETDDLYASAMLQPRTQGVF